MYLYEGDDTVPFCFKHVQRLMHPHFDEEVPDVVVHHFRVLGDRGIWFWRLEGCYVTLQKPLHCKIKVFTDVIITGFLTANPGQFQ